MNNIYRLVDERKLGGWVRSCVGALLVGLIAAYPGLGDYMDASTQMAVAVAVSGVAVGAWSHFVKHKAAK